MELLIVSGLSGAGKSVAMNALEDIDLNDLFLAVCKTPDNMNTMLESMNQVMQEMVE